MNNVINRVVFLSLVLMSGCHYTPGEDWRITVGLDKPKEKVVYEGEQAREVRLCLESKGGSGYPTRVVAKFDDQRYANILEGQCMFFKGKKVVVAFGNPSSGKYAYGTFSIVEEQSE